MSTDGEGTVYAVDRIEGGTAILVRDDGERVELPVDRLPPGAGEGTVLRVKEGGDDGPDWATATLDEAERRRRLDEGEEILEELRKRDPGGDVTL